LLSAAYWLINGVSGPVAPTAAPVVPVLVSVSSASGLQQRTLVLRSAGGQVSYSLQRGLSPALGEADLVPEPAAQRALDTAVATLVAPNGGEADDQGQSLAQFDIGFVLLPAPVDQNLARTLDGVAGLRPKTATSAFDLWQLVDPAARARVVEPDGTVVPLRSGPVSVSNVAVPAAGGTLELAEPAGGWSATLNGKPLTQVPSPAGAWAQAFRLPPGGGLVSISRDQTSHDIALMIEVLALVAVAVLALPGTRAAAADSAHGAGSSAAAGRDAGEPAQSERPGAGGRRTARQPAGERSGRSLRGQRQGRSRGRGPRRAGRSPALSSDAAAGLAPAAAAGQPGARSDRSPDVTPAGSFEQPDRQPAGSGRPPAGMMAGAPSGRSPDWPGADQPSSWGAADQRTGWPEGDQRTGWDRSDQGPGWSDAGQRPDWPGADQRPAAQPAGRSAGQSQAWPSSHGDLLDPLPPADGTGPAWTGSAAGDVPPPRWPVPDRDTEGETW